MSELLGGAMAHVHGLLVHFPIALLLVSVVLDFMARRLPQWRLAAWYSLLLGSAATLPATVSGLIAHLPYEESAQLPLIEQHQYLAFATTGLFLVLALWRWLARRRGRDIGVTLPYAAGALLGVAVLVLTAYNGHTLVFFNGIGVSGNLP